MTLQLTTTDHSRDIAGLKYVYPVLSRRSGGLSIGINFNTNNACNWRCIYCQVPDLTKGSAPEVDLDLLNNELAFFLNEVLQGNFYDRYDLDNELRVIKDIAISGNGEPTSIKNFTEALSLICDVVSNSDLPEQIRLILITNGSLIQRQNVQQGLEILNDYQGEVWFKLDSATVTGRDLINNAAISQEKYVNNLITAAKLCPTWLQTCIFSIHGRCMPSQEQHAYLALLMELKQQVELQGVLLYSIARPSLQPEAATLTKLSSKKIYEFADSIKALGFNVQVSV